VKVIEIMRIDLSAEYFLNFKSMKLKEIINIEIQ